MRFDVITIFPGFFEGPFEHGIIRRARKKGLIETHVHDLRTFADDRHRTVDDRPFGGGEGMVLKPGPIFDAVESVTRRRVPGGTETPDGPQTQQRTGTEETSSRTTEVVVLSAAGRTFNQAEALRLARADQIVLIAGRYEGIDERVTEHLATAEISIGDFIVSGGEIAAVVVVDAVTRYVPGAVGKEESVLRDSFSDPAAPSTLVEHPHYTRPAEFRGLKVPDILLSGDHEAVARWRHVESLKKTERNRPDLIERGLLEEADLRALEEARKQ